MEKTFTTKNFECLKSTCEKIISISNENVNGHLMVSQMMFLGDLIKEFKDNPLVKNSGV